MLDSDYFLPRFPPPVPSSRANGESRRLERGLKTHLGRERERCSSDGRRERIVRAERFADPEQLAEVMRRINAQARAREGAQRALLDQAALYRYACWSVSSLWK